MKNGGIFFTSRFWLTKLDVADIGVLQNRLKNKKPRISARFFCGWMTGLEPASANRQDKFPVSGD